MFVKTIKAYHYILFISPSLIYHNWQFKNKGTYIASGKLFQKALELSQTCPLKL